MALAPRTGARSSPRSHAAAASGEASGRRAIERAQRRRRQHPAPAARPRRTSSMEGTVRDPIAAGPHRCDGLGDQAVVGRQAKPPLQPVRHRTVGVLGRVAVVGGGRPAVLPFGERFVDAVHRLDDHRRPEVPTRERLGEPYPAKTGYAETATPARPRNPGKQGGPNRAGESLRGIREEGPGRQGRPVVVAIRPHIPTRAAGAAGGHVKPESASRKD